MAQRIKGIAPLGLRRRSRQTHFLGKSGTSTVWKKFSIAWITFSMAWKNRRKVFHAVEVPDFSPRRSQGSRAATESSEPSTQGSQRAQKERKRRIEQPCSRQGRGERKGAFVGRGGGRGLRWGLACADRSRAATVEGSRGLQSTGIGNATPPPPRRVATVENKRHVHRSIAFPQRGSSGFSRWLGGPDSPTP
jgi:hypothetical protein